MFPDKKQRLLPEEVYSSGKSAFASEQGAFVRSLLNVNNNHAAAGEKRLFLSFVFLFGAALVAPIFYIGLLLFSAEQTVYPVDRVEQVADGGVMVEAVNDVRDIF